MNKNKRIVKLDNLDKKNKKDPLHYHQCNIGNHLWGCNEDHIYIRLGTIKDLYCYISPCDSCINKMIVLLEENNII